MEEGSLIMWVIIDTHDIVPQTWKADNICNGGRVLGVYCLSSPDTDCRWLEYSCSRRRHASCTPFAAGTCADSPYRCRSLSPALSCCSCGSGGLGRLSLWKTPPCIPDIFFFLSWEGAGSAGWAWAAPPRHTHQPCQTCSHPRSTQSHPTSWLFFFSWLLDCGEHVKTLEQTLVLVIYEVPRARVM